MLAKGLRLGLSWRCPVEEASGPGRFHPQPLLLRSPGLGQHLLPPACPPQAQGFVLPQAGQAWPWRVCRVVGLHLVRNTPSLTSYRWPRVENRICGRMQKRSSDHSCIKNALLAGSSQVWCLWDCWAVVEFILPLICSHNDVGIVGLVLSTVVLVSLPFLWGNAVSYTHLTLPTKLEV